MDIITIGEKIIKWLLSYNAKRNEEINGFIKEIQNKCIRLIKIEDPYCDEATFLHEEIKTLYDIASSKLPLSHIDEEGWNLYKALSSARIYYWLRIIENDKLDQLNILLDDLRDKPSSFNQLLEMLNSQTNQNKGIDLRRVKLERIRLYCLEDIAKLSELRPFFR